MRLGTILLSTLGSLTFFSSCKTLSNYEKAQDKQYKLIAEERAIIDKNKTPVLVPNGHLSSVVGDDVAYFLTKNDSTAFDQQVRLANGIVTDVQAKKNTALKNITNNYNNEVNSLTNYYNNAKNNRPKISELVDLEAYYNKETKRLNEHYNILKKAVEQEYHKEMKQAKQMKSTILRKAGKMPGVLIEKGGARFIRSAL